MHLLYYISEQKSSVFELKFDKFAERFPQNFLGKNVQFLVRKELGSIKLVDKKSGLRDHSIHLKDFAERK